MILTNSSMSTFNLCQRRYYYRYELCLQETTQSVPLVIGSKFHDGLEVILRRGSLAEAKIAIFGPPTGSPEDESHTAFFLLEHYVEHYSAPGAGGVHEGTLLAVEELLQAKLAPGVTAKGLADAVYEDSKGVWLMEHKTTSRIDMDYLEKVSLDGQISLYLLLFERMTGIRPVGVLYNVIARPSAYRRVGEDISHYLMRSAADYRTLPRKFFGRQPAYRDDHLVLEKEQETIVTVKRIQSARRRRVWCKNDSICFARSRRCPYVELCSIGLTTRTLAPFSKVPAHNELADRKQTLL